ncbi:MAG: hypothetical protein AB7G80_09225 [Dongiaceae bacterium]
MARHRIVEGLKMGESPLRPVGVRLFVCIDHDGFHGSGSGRASVVVAKDEVHARELLDKALERARLMPFKRCRYRLSEIPLDRWTAEILADGSL